MKWLWAVSALVLVGCGQSSNTANVSGKVEGELEVAAFQGGYDIDFYQKCADEFAKKNSGIKVKLWGDPRVWEQLRPRFAGGNPPDLVFPGWGMDHWALVEEGQLIPLDDALDGPPVSGEGKWRDTFDPNLLKLCQKDGKTWMLPYYVMNYGWWYDENVFKANGWTPPKTWTELLALCTKIKAEGMSPISFQGKYPYYMIEGMLLPWCFSAGGVQAVRDAQNLEPGAWSSPAMLQAATMIDELNKRQFFEPGAVGLSHTEAQMNFLLGKAAMVPCGSWIEAEMSKQLDEIAKSGKPRPVLRYLSPPHVDQPATDSENALIGIEPWMVPSKAKNPASAIALFKYMTSLENAKAFVKEKGTLMSIIGSDEGDIPEVLKAPAAAMKSAKYLWANQCRAWYPEFNKEIENALTSLLNREISPKEFCERVEKKAEATRADPDIEKHKVSF